MLGSDVERSAPGLPDVVPSEYALETVEPPAETLPPLTVLSEELPLAAAAPVVPL